MEMPSMTDQALVYWRKSLQPRRVDIVGDFAGKELFGIHGEALVAHCIALAQVDYQDGFQLLHAVYAVERFLSDLRRCGCNFHVLWFDDYRGLSVPHSAGNHAIKYLLTRDVLVEHFRDTSTAANPESSESTIHAYDRSISFVFPSLSSREYRQYTTKNALHFVMCSAVESAESYERSVDGFAAMQAFMCAGYSVGFMNDVEFCNTKVYTNTVTYSQSSPSLEISRRQPRSRQPLHQELKWRLMLEQLSRHTWMSSTNINIREWIAIIACSSILLAEPSAENSQHVVAFLVHIALLARTSLTQRSCPKPTKGNGGGRNLFLEKYSYVASNLLRNSHQFNSGHEANMDVFDLVDGRLYKHVLDCPGALYAISEVNPYLRVVRDLTGSNALDYLPDRAIPLDGKICEDSTLKVEGNHAKPEPVYTLLPFNHPIFDKHLDDVRLQTDSSEEPDNKSLIFHDLTHWHNADQLIDPKPAKKPLGYYARKRNQKYMADTVAYSASLTNASGKNIDPEIIVVKTGTSKVSHGKPSSAKQKQPPKSAKREKRISGRQAAHEAATTLQAKRMESKSSTVVRFWDERCKEFQEEKSLVRRYLKASKYLSSLSKFDMEAVGAEVLLFLCGTLCRYTESMTDTADATSHGVLSLIWAKVLEMQRLPMNAETRRLAGLFSAAFNLPLGPATPGSVARRLPFDIIIHKPTAIAPKSHIEFQLENCGPYLERSFDSAPDSRVPFNPDAWQRKVLDAIDEDKSLFVVAPTSAGKTFISFYAMKKVLQENDDDVLVYVAPTKALVNQIAAEVQARFSKSYSHDGRSVWAIHTRDYRVNNPNGCQVLVTVPHILQIMLLAPSNAQTPKSWARRVRRIIFDEVHCIGQADDGIIWEQLLLLAPCPIIALSATVGNPLEFKEWLAGTQKAKGFDLIMVTHSARYSDLRKFIYTPQEDFKFEGLKNIDQLPLSGLDAHNSSSSSRFAFVHPIGSIASRDKGTLEDISLEPRDCLRLWRAMRACANDAFPMDSELHPEHFLPLNMKKSHVLEWEKRLKAHLLSWMTDNLSPFTACQKILGSKTEESTREDIDSTFPLLVDLQSLGALPAILFSYDREECENILFTILHKLEAAEQKYKETSSVWRRKMAGFENWKMTESKSQIKSTKSVKQPGMTKEDVVRENAAKDHSPWKSFYPDDPLLEYSFADMTKISRGEMEALLLPLRSLVKQPFIDALWRGLGVHHSGMNRQYRQVVELLFRRSVLTAVIATGTLALGINMPCKTVVFTGDSVFLTALNYRQGSGRAGRRGFDLLGNVVFHRIQHHRAKEIMSSRLPDLRGTFPISVTLVLRLVGLLHGTHNSEYAIKAIESLFTQTRLYLGGPASRMSIKHHLRFSIEYLRRQNLLSADGKPLNFAGLVGHLYFTENAVFAFHSLLKEGYFHELSMEIGNRNKRDDILLELLTVLCHLFCRVPCHRYNDGEWLSKVVRSSPSIVILPSLPRQAKDILEAHNKETLDIFAAYVRTYVEQHLTGTVDNKLPFTQRLVAPKKTADIACVGVPILPTPVIRSPFAALSGLTDQFNSIRDLVTTTRTDVFLEESAIPYIPIYPEETNNIPFNAYIFDFFRHGDMQALVRDNGIKLGDIWFALKDFSLVLATIVASMGSFLDQEARFDEATMADVQDFGDRVEEGSVAEENGSLGAAGESSEREPNFINVYTALKLLHSEFDEKFKKIWA